MMRNGGGGNDEFTNCTIVRRNEKCACNYEKNLKGNYLHSQFVQNFVLYTKVFVVFLIR
jgi:hypothetical protein